MSVSVPRKGLAFLGGRSGFELCQGVVSAESTARLHLVSCLGHLHAYIERRLIEVSSCESGHLIIFLVAALLCFAMIVVSGERRSMPASLVTCGATWTRFRLYPRQSLLSMSMPVTNTLPSSVSSMRARQFIAAYPTSYILTVSGGVCPESLPGRPGFGDHRGIGGGT